MCPVIFLKKIITIITGILGINDVVAVQNTLQANQLLVSLFEDENLRTWKNTKLIN